jgi:hypothetical protein
MNRKPEARSPVSFRASVVRLPRRGLPVTIDADEKQRAALAGEHGLLSVERFHADLVVANWKGDGVRVGGRVEADFTQACVVSLEPLAARVDEEVSAIFVPEDSRLAPPGRAGSGEILLDAEGPDGPETFSGDWIDVGQLAEEFFALAIDPYPHKEGVALPAARAEQAPGGAADGALAEKLATLRGKT